MAVTAGAAETPVTADALLGVIGKSTGVMGLSFGIDAGYANGWALNGWGFGASTDLLAV
jgi:hypothetical protein